MTTSDDDLRKAKAKLRQLWRDQKTFVILGFFWMLPSLIVWFVIGVVNGVRERRELR